MNKRTGGASAVRELGMPAEEKSFEAVYRAHLGFVWRSLRRIGIPEEQLEDTAHDVFLVVYRRLTEFDGSSSIRTWLFGIARRVAANRRRKTATRRRLAPRISEASAPEPSPEQRVRELEAAALVEEFLDALEDEARQTFELSQIEGLTAPEIAKLLGVNVNTVYTRVRTVKRRFAEFLERRTKRERQLNDG